MASATLNVKVPDKLREELDAFLERNPGYMSRSEAVRDAIRHLLKEQGPALSEETLAVIEEGKEQVEEGEGRTLEEVKARLDG